MGRYKSIKKYSFSESNSKSHEDHSIKNMKQNSYSGKSCKVISKLLIPEDLVFDILSFLPVKCLLNSARYVCKSWATTIRSSLFAEACLHRAHSKPGLYVENCKHQNNYYFLDIKDDVNSLFEFERSNMGTPQKMGNIVDTCDGILLLCHGPRFSS
ncbi:putative F-box domain-containing protein [Medicago truncatula]|uniref:F-box-like protein n=1 Tax=Medicago truncatula TaxID=3880 RepID=G7JXG3_MEDTR|nr:F-box-like protein [Medicago truncatula]RHN53786.1 putative F-box domain-containing protein [Medicago truncatula]